MKVGNKKGNTKKKRNKPGYRETDRLCRFCNELIPVDKSLYKHHISYKQNVVLPLHYNCHGVVHGNLKYNCPYDKKYGVDLSPVFRARAILKMYEKYPDIMKEIGEIEDNNEK